LEWKNFKHSRLYNIIYLSIISITLTLLSLNLILEFLMVFKPLAVPQIINTPSQKPPPTLKCILCTRTQHDITLVLPHLQFVYLCLYMNRPHFLVPLINGFQPQCQRKEVKSIATNFDICPTTLRNFFFPLGLKRHGAKICNFMRRRNAYRSPQGTELIH